MPTRILRDGIIDSRAVNALSESGEILYRRLMSIVDDYGRFEADPELIRARCFPRQLDRWTIQRITDVLPELTVIHGELRLVTVYAVESKKYLQINNFGQRVQCKEKYPSPDSRESTVIHGDSPSSRSRSSVVVVEGVKASAPKSGAVDAWFESEFWPTWTRAANDSRGAALKAARAKVKDRETQELVIEGARRQRKARLAQEPQYRSHAATWLNQSRWIDGDEEAEEAQEIHRPLPPPKFWVDDLLDPK